MACEIERKFLVRGGFKHLASSFSRIKQGYIFQSKGKSLRVRLKGRTAFLTIKGKSSADGLIRYEWEKEISPEDAEELFKLCENSLIDKTRYYVHFKGHIFEVDEFHGDNAGLVMAELELSNEDEDFEKPPFLGDEVTGDIKYYNSRLSMFPFKDWR